jgi:arylsulfatase A-like enzyme
MLQGLVGHAMSDSRIGNRCPRWLFPAAAGCLPGRQPALDRPNTCGISPGWFLRSLFLGLAILLANRAFAQDGPATGRPNIVFIIADDLAVDAIAALDVWPEEGRTLQTPNIDRLVRRGTSFRAAYNMGSWSPAVCICSRSMLITGRSLWRCRELDREGHKEAVAAGQLWPQRMQAAGYGTWMAGKWHVPVPAEKVFGHTRNIRPGMPKTVDSAYWRPLDGEAGSWSPFDHALGGYWEGGKHWSEVLADDAAAILAEATASGHPYFMYLAFNAPHDPRQSPEEYVRLYPPESVPVPGNFLPVNPHHAAMGLGAQDRSGLRDEALAPFPRTEHAVRVHRQEYYALVSHLDWQVGRMVDVLETSGQLDNTVIVFTSDHGLAIGRHGLMGKQSLYEHSVRVPLVFAGPGIEAGQTIDTPVYLQDAMATVLELAGASREGTDFRSLVPLMRQPDDGAREAIIGAYLDRAQRSVRSGPHKLVLYPDGPVAILFNLERDPLELHDLAGKPESLQLQRRLFAQLKRLQQELGDPLDLAAAFPQLADDQDP